jgi:1-acyl-sn-glycerol-3-phosphate acyltransferase
MSLLAIVMILSADTGEKMAWVTFYSLLPFLIFGQIFGVLSDRLSRKRIMIISDILRAMLVALIPFIIKHSSSFTYIYLVVFCVGTLSALFLPAKMAIIPNLIKKEQLVSANSLIASTGMFATLVGTLIAGYLIKLFGPYSTFLLNSLTFIISAIMIASIFIDKASKEKPALSVNNIFQGIKEGLGFMNRHQLILRVTQLNAAFSLLSSFFYITILNYSNLHLKLSSEGYGILLSCLGLGLSFGALLLGRRIGKLNYNRILLLGFALISLMSLIFILRPDFKFSVLLLIMGGAGASLVMVTLDSLLQRSTPDSLRANVFGARGIITNAVFLVSLVIVGKALNRFSAIYIFVFIGVASFVIAFLIYLSEGPLGYRILRGVLRLILRIFFKLKVRGIENLPQSRRVILAGNHTSLMDGVVVMAAYPRKVYFLVAESVFKKKFLGFVSRHLGFIPVKKESLNKEAIREAIRILESRSALGIFPEGRITADGKLTEGKGGVAMIALKTGASVIPFAIEGAYYAWPLLQKYPRRHPIEIRFGKPLDVRDYDFPQELTNDVMEAIKKIKLEEEKDGLLEVDPNVIVRHIINFG